MCYGCYRKTDSDQNGGALVMIRTNEDDEITEGIFEERVTSIILTPPLLQGRSLSRSMTKVMNGNAYGSRKLCRYSHHFNESKEVDPTWARSHNYYGVVLDGVFATPVCHSSGSVSSDSVTSGCFQRRSSNHIPLGFVIRGAL